MTPLDKPSRFFRSPVARGLATGSGSSGILSPVDPTGGDEGAGIIRGMAIITRGEALGHGMWIDETFLSQVSSAVNTKAGGVKQRFTHPSLSGDGLGKGLGRTKNSVRDGDVVRGDLHFSKLSHKTPDGDLAEYIMGMADESPEDFGNSIAFEHDPAAEEKFALDHGATWKEDPYLGRYLCFDAFVSPDPMNTENLPHCRLGELRAVDVVDDPAANPNGLFHKGQEVPEAAEKLMCFALGLSAERPEQSVFDINPDRITGFVQRFLSNHGLEITKMRSEMSVKTAPEVEDPVEELAPAAVETDESDEGATPEAVDVSATDPVPEKTDSATGLSAGKKFLQAFGDKGGVWFAEGKTFDEAQSLFNQELREQNERLAAENKQLKDQATALRGEDPVSHVDPAPEKVNKETQRLSQNLGSGLGRFASSITLPGHN